MTSLFSVYELFLVCPAYIHSDRGQSFMSAELKTFLQSHGVATSRTTPYSPQSNGQCERYNGIIWKAVTLALESLGLKETQWESVLPDALHSVRTNPGPILMKKHVCATKYDPLVEELDLLEANPTYAHVRLPYGRETTVSVRHLAPRGQSISNDNLDHSVLNVIELWTFPKPMLKIQHRKKPTTRTTLWKHLPLLDVLHVKLRNHLDLDLTIN
ncbi:Hypothetical predicted protein [Mytilus galloprovincialis]|uniref:Integrase catalytic domain-containing protein n=1 Tax=Mytilus galloprovincialis TaxID=29158 RepID=A0A8B6DDC6_MYTGA|nr:Hypothetical predicted protein [Mytilus galloprovincialis]